MIGRSTKVLINDEIVPLTEEIKHQLQHQNEEFSKCALRVLAFAYRPLTVSEDEELHLGLEEELIFVGLMAMIDPPSEGSQASRGRREIGWHQNSDDHW